MQELVWAAFILASKDMEMSCDEAVVKKLGAEIRADYSASLLSLATGHRMIAGTPLAFCEGDTKGRIKNMAKWKKPTLLTSIVALVVVVVVCVILMINPSSQKHEKKYSGLIVAHGGNPLVLQLQGDDGKNYGFVVKNGTALLWEDDELFYDENLSEDEKWDLLFTGMHAEIIAGKKTASAEESINENVDEWFVAEKITITEIPKISSESTAMD